MINKLARLSTTLRREEAWELDDLAQAQGVRRSHIMRGMLRYVMQTSVEDFLTWLDETDGQPIEAPSDPLPEEGHHGG